MAECKHTASNRAMAAAVEMEVHAALSTATVGKARALDTHFLAYDDMLEALKLVREFDCKHAPALLSLPYFKNMHDAVFAAIAKAEGRSHD